MPDPMRAVADATARFEVDLMLLACHARMTMGQYWTMPRPRDGVRFWPQVDVEHNLPRKTPKNLAAGVLTYAVINIPAMVRV
jgi:hypothetical protein